MNKDKAYCQICNSELIQNENNFEYKCDCYKSINRKRILLWCEKCQRFTSRQGTYILSKCCRCAVILQHKTMKEKDPEGYSKRQAAASIKANKIMKEHNLGIYNSLVRKEIEATKHKNGFYIVAGKRLSEWKKENPELAKEACSKGAISANKNRKENFSEEDWLNWVKRSCNNKISNDKKTISKSNNSVKNFCNKCNKITFHLNGMCTKCYPSSGTGRKYSLAFNFQPSFKIIDNTKFYFDKTSKSYISWSKYKEKIYKGRNTKNIEYFIEKLKILDIFHKNMSNINSFDLSDIIQVIPTFRTQESSNWNGSKIAFEQSLIEQNIGWFTYIKFYIDKNSNAIRPLVVGKSGSLNVNSSGSDVSFSTNEDHGPARKFLYETNQNWDKTQILIIKAKSEKQSFYYEYKIQKVFNLFES